MKRQYSIPDEIISGTVRVLQTFRRQLEAELPTLIRAGTPLDDYSKLTLLVGRLESFYNYAEDALTAFQVSWDDREGNRRDLRLDTLQDALLEAADRYKVYDHVEISLI